MGATADGLLVAAHWRDGFDGAGFVALAKDKTRDAAAVSDSVGPCGAILCGGGAAGDECGSVGGKRSLCAQVGARTGAAGASKVFCDSQMATGEEWGRRGYYVKRSRILYHAPASGSAQVLPLRKPKGAAGKGMEENGVVSVSPQTMPASFVPNQVAAATP